MKNNKLNNKSTKSLQKIFLIMFFIGFSLYSFSQNINVSGVVKDVNGETIPGVAVQMQDSTYGTATDIDGKYSLKVPANATLVFSSVGSVTQYVPVNNRTVINISLSEDVEQVDDVVVVGYGTVKRSHVTGSVSKVKNENLDQIPVARVDEALVGQIAGVQVSQTNPSAGEAPSIVIRGQGSISYNSNPLIVVDGIVVGNDADFLSSIDMNDVESIEVLKDASSGAIYGSRGANGIIMITTKGGVEGPTKFSYHTNVGFKTVPKNDILTTPEEWAEYVKENNNGELTDKMEYIQRMGTSTDWEDVVFDGGIIQNHSISASGGTKNTKFKTSLSYMDDQGVLLTDNYEKVNFRINLNTKLRDNIKFGIDLNPSYTNQQRFPVGVHDALRQNSWLPLYLDENNIQYVNRFREDGRWADAEIGDYAMERMFDDYDLETGMPTADGTGTDISSTSNASALAKILERDYKKQQTKIYAKTYLMFDIIKGLRFKQSFGGDYRFTKNTTWIGTEATRNGATDTRSTRKTQSRWHIVTESTLNYNKEIKGHTFDVLGGFAYENWRSEEAYLEGVGYSNDLIQTIPSSNQIGGYNFETQESLISYLGRLNYDFKSRYFVSASIRTDGSSKFGSDSKFGWFPAISAGWTLSKEKFFPQNRIVSDVKLRASYGVTGNNNGIGEYDYLGIISPVNTGFGTIGYNSTNIENNDLQWEKQTEINPGIDAAFFGRRLNLSVDYYRRRSVDLLLDVPIPSVTGFETSLVNKGIVQNEGIEVEILSKNVNTKNFSWNTSVIASHNKNTLVDFADADGLITIVDDKRPAEWIALEGNPISSFYGYVVEKEIPLEYIDNPFYPINAQSQDVYVKDLNGDGIIDPDDRTILGSPYPDFVWSLNNSFKYKDFDLSFMFQGSHGAEVRNISSQYINNEFSSNQDYVTGFEDADKVVERIFTSDDIQDASYVALRNFNIGYTIPTKLLSKIKLQRARVYFSAQNLLYFWSKDYTGYNPEGIDQGLDSPLTYGYQRGPAPIYKSYSFGVNIDF